MRDIDMGVTSRTTSARRGGPGLVAAVAMALVLTITGCTDGSTTESADAGQESAPLAPASDTASSETSTNESTNRDAPADDEVSVVSVSGSVSPSSTAGLAQDETASTSTTAASSAAATTSSVDQATSTTAPASTSQTPQTSATSGTTSSSAAPTSTAVPTTTTAAGAESSIVTIAVDPADPALQGFDWPSDGELGVGFVVIVHPVYGTERLHAGQDFRIPKGSPVLAARDGTVVSASLTGGYGNLVVLDHGDGVQTRYAHLDEILVAAGDAVSTGQEIARSGASGTTTGPVLFFQMQIGDDPFDPLLILPPR